MLGAAPGVQTSQQAKGGGQGERGSGGRGGGATEWPVSSQPVRGRVQTGPDGPRRAQTGPNEENEKNEKNEKNEAHFSNFHNRGQRSAQHTVKLNNLRRNFCTNEKNEKNEENEENEKNEENETRNEENEENEENEKNEENEGQPQQASPQGLDRRASTPGHKASTQARPEDVPTARARPHPAEFPQQAIVDPFHWQQDLTPPREPHGEALQGKYTETPGGVSPPGRYQLALKIGAKSQQERGTV